MIILGIRDSPNRSLGKGEDWNKDNHYNVVTTITYLISSKIVILD